MLFDVQAALSEILASTLATPATIATNSPETLTLSRLSRVSQLVTAEAKNPKSAPGSTRTVIIQAMRLGLKTPGSIAAAAKLGATDAYQELDRMAREGLVTMQPDGALRLTAAAEQEATP